MGRSNRDDFLHHHLILSNPDEGGGAFIYHSSGNIKCGGEFNHPSRLNPRNLSSIVNGSGTSNRSMDRRRST